MPSKNRMIRYMLYVLVAFTVILLGYLVVRSLLYQQSVEAAERIELAVFQTCNIEISVEPSTVSLYDIAYWSSVEQISPEEGEVLITCYIANNDEWQCVCEDDVK